MGRNIPKGRIKQVQYFESMIDVWKEDPAAIGLTVAQVDDLETELIAARGVLTDVTEARLQARALTSNFHALSDRLHATGAGLILTIKAFAVTSTNPSAILSAARVFAPLGPGAPLALETPSIRGFTLLGNGALLVKISARGPGGTVYLVRRKLAGKSDIKMLGTGTKKKFIDTTIPPGTVGATYYVQAIRGNSVSASSTGIVVAFSCKGGVICTENIAKAQGLHAA